MVGPPLYEQNQMVFNTNHAIYTDEEVRKLKTPSFKPDESSKHVRQEPSTF